MERFFFALSIILKVFPAIWGIHILISHHFKKTLKVFLSICFTLLFLLLITLPYRSIGVDFYEFFTALASKASHVNTDLFNQSLLAALFRFFTTSYYGNHKYPYVTWVSLDPEMVKYFHLILAILCLGVLIILSYGTRSSRKKDEEKSHFILFSLYLLYMLIFSPVSWLHYHVLSLPAIYCLLTRVSWPLKDPGKKFIFFVLIFLILSNVLTGRDIIGRKLSDLLRSHSHALLSNLLLFIALMGELKKDLKSSLTTLLRRY